ncbi:type I polyketide synthase [Fimbriiglobus ruber]|uniref:Omega-3 polyunsaturated fatty acid synthase subunit, PfaA n=1 Tax=Fimbriiglobus ruber TaxID=1908690 RepID=A0A225DYG0_9BACT|nr:type I polyketide synthase [Fimbriiglobus ruber]OWK42289.1 omega-3 polyunsaturated fatty acid synthase subunit, PfaA [Fimbriiglobus ruber]
MSGHPAPPEPDTGPRSALRAPRSAVAIVGIGCLFPKANGTGTYWGAIKNGVDCITPVPPTHWNPDDYFDPDPKKPDMTYARRGGFLSPVDFNPLEFGIAPRDIEATDTSQLLGLVAAKHALTDAGVVFTDSPAGAGKTPPPPSPTGNVPRRRPVDRNRVSVILGVTGTLELVIPLGARLGHPKWRKAMKDAGVPDETAEDAIKRIGEAYVPWQENSFPGLLGNVVAGRIASRLDLGGTNCVVDAACASSLSAVHLAALELSTGRSDVAVTGGVDTFNDIFMYMCFSKTPALSASGDVRPFEATGDGTMIGEGVGVVVLKRLSDAERDGDTIYAVIKGIGTSSDGKGTAIYAPSAAGQKKAIRTAYQLAGVAPDTIELVEAHGTGTRVGDATEASALVDVYNDLPTAPAGGPKPRPWCALGSVKSQIGHTKAAAGAASLIKAALALYYKVLPPTLKVTRPVDPLAVPDSPFYVNTKARPWLPRAEHPRRAALSAFGFGGSNFHCVLEEHRYEKPAVDWDGAVEILALGGATAAAVSTALAAVGTDWPAFARAAEQSRGTFDPAAPCRLVVVAHRDLTDLPKLVAGATAKLAAEPAAAAWQTPDGVYYGTGPCPGSLAVLFPGQGSQYTGMLRDLACTFPELLDALAAANDEVAAQQRDESDGRRLTDRIYPPTAFDADAPRRHEEALRATEAAQPAIGAVSFGAWQVLSQRFGLGADAFAGHSYGELPALAAAGRIESSELFALSRLRGRLMAQQRVGDPGTMLAVFAPAAEIEAVVQSGGFTVVAANRNTPTQTVLSGATPEIEKVEAALAAKGIRAVRLPVAAAFHSPLVADAAVPFRAALDGIAFAPGMKPVYANTTATVYPDDPDAARELLGHQIANPVAFVDEVRAMCAAGVRTFVEVGPGRVLTQLVAAIASDPAAAVPGVEAAALDASSGKRPGLLDLGHLLARLAARGHAVRLAAWEEGSRCRPPAPAKPGLTIPICGANYVTPRPTRPPVAPVPPNDHRPLTPAGVQMPEPAKGPSPAADQAGVAQALQLTHQTLAALQQMQDQTARLHRQFLESQEQAQRTLFQLVAQQQALLFPGGTAPAPVAAPVPAANTAPPAWTPTVPPTQAPAAEPTVPSVPHAIAPVPAPAAVVVDPAPVHPPAEQSPSVPAAQPALAAAPVPQPTLPVAQISPAVAAPAPVTVPHHPPKGTNGVAPNGAGANGTVTHDVESILLSVVAEKTGYPVEMLDPGMSLDADLGVDSIKRVEILSAIQEKLPHAPAVKPEHLGTLHTLQDIILFLSAGMGAGVTALAPVPAAATSLAQPAGPAVASPAPVEMLAPAATIPLAQLVRETQEAVDFAAPLPTSSGDSVRLMSPVESGATSLPNTAEIETLLLKVVAEKTGYPEGMLDPDMALDTDLGVDSIKRVEILSAIQEKLPHAPVVKPEHLGTLHTVRDIAEFLSAGSFPNTTKINVKVVPAPRPEDSLLAAPSTQRLASKPARVLPPGGLEPGLSELLAPKTEPLGRVAPPPPPPPLSDLARRPAQTPTTPVLPAGPVDTYRAPVGPINLDRVDRSILQAVDLDPIPARQRLALPERGEVWVVAPEDALTREVVVQLTAQRFVPKLFPWVDPDAAAPAGSPVGLVLIAPVRTAPNVAINKLGFRWLQAAGPKLRHAARQPNGAAFATVARLDGTFGLGDLAPGTDPVPGGLAGLVKTARHEWPEIGSKAIDLAAGFAAESPAASAVAVVEEILLAGPVEVGIGPNNRCTLDLARTVRRAAPTAGPVLGPKDVVLVTGGARGVTAEVAVSLAEVYQPTMILTGRTPAATGPEPDALKGVTDEAALKKAIADHLGAGATPKAVGDMYAKVNAQREIAKTLARIEAAGAKATYFSVNVANGRQVADVLHQVQVKYGPVTALVHGAGVLADRRIEDLTADQFDAVYSTKVDGLRNLLDLLGNQDLKAVVLFSSTTARFGRVGQLAYATANEVLNKTAQIEARKRPAARVVAINWGPWEGGMVTPALRKVFESEGIGLIPLTEGGLFAVQELTVAGRAVEVIALGKPRTSKSGSGPAPALGASGTPLPPPAAAPVTGPPPAELAVAFEESLTIDGYPVLRSHVLDARAVLPMALHMEFLAHAALHGNPGLVFHGFNDLRITHGVMVEEGTPTVLKALAGKAIKHDKMFHVPVELRGKRRDGRDAIHSRAEVVLTAAFPKAPAADPPPIVQPYPHPVEEVYRYFLFHGPDLHGIERVDGLADTAFIGTAYPAPAPLEWLTKPLRSAWVADPLVIDASFQMMILWSFAQHGAGSLPCFAGRYRQYRRAFPAGPARVVIRVTRDNGSFARADIDYLDADGIVIAQVQDYECVIDRQLDQAFRRNQLAPRVKN